MPNFANTSSLSVTRPITHSRETRVSKREDHNELRFALTSSLENALKIEDALSHFYKMIKKAIKFNGMDYKHAAQNVEYTFGTRRAHKAKYTLKIPGDTLGEITFFCAKPFSEIELTAIESLLGALIPPLRNALLYNEAVERSLQDPLTKTGNRAAMELALKREFTLANRKGQAFSVLMADIDFFKRVNDSEGHSAGDKLLIQLVKVFKDTLRETDQVFRYGGEEFMVLLNYTDHGDAMITAERLRSAMDKTSIKGCKEDSQLNATISIGVSTYLKGDSQEQLLNRADTALYRAKENGRNRVESSEATQPPPLKATKQQIAS